MDKGVSLLNSLGLSHTYTYLIAAYHFEESIKIKIYIISI